MIQKSSIAMANRFFVLLCIILIYLSFFNHYTLIIDVEDTDSSTYQVFWETKHENFKESNSIVFQGSDHLNRIKLVLRSSNPIKKLRIDLPHDENRFVIRSIKLRRFGYMDIGLRNFSDIDILHRHQIEVDQSDDALILGSNGMDPYFVFPAELTLAYLHYVLGLIALIILMLSISTIVKYLKIKSLGRILIAKGSSLLNSPLSRLERSIPQVRASPQNVFVLSGAVFGILMIIITPPFQSPDGFEHFYKSCAVSYGQIIPETNMAQLPKGVKECSEPLEVLPFHPQNKFSLGLLENLARIPWQENDWIPLLIPNMTRNPAIIYLPQAAGIAMGRKVSDSPLICAYYGSVTNLLFYLGCIYLTIYLLPFFKWTMCLLALMPMPFFLAASLSADSVNLVLLLLYLAIVVKLIFDPGKYQKSLLILSVIGAFIIGSCKPGYIFFILLTLLIPRKRFGNTRVQLGFLFCVFGLGLASAYFWNSLAKELFVPSNIAEPNIDLDRQLNFILSNPITYARIMANTLSINGIFYLESSVGILGWLDTRLPLFLIFWYPIALVGTSFNDIPHPFKIKLYHKYMFITIIALSFVYILTAIYLTWDSVGDSAISGIQGRYLLPLIPLVLLILFHNRQEVFSYPKLSRFLTVLTILVSNLITLFALWQRYW